MKTTIGSGSKTARKNKELNSSKLSISSSDMNELENKYKKLEMAIAKLTTQNEVLTKRVDDLEARNSKQIKKSTSQRSFSTLNNTMFTEAEIMEDFNTGTMNSNSNRPVPPLNLNVISPRNNSEMIEWKKDIEKSIETISAKVAANNNNVLVNLLEKRINDTNNEVTKLKKAFDDNVDNTNIIKRNIDKFDRTEKLISGLLTQISEMKNHNLKWQAEFLKSLNDFNEKLVLQESSMEQHESFERIVQKKIENVINEIKNIRTEHSMKMEEIESKHWGKINALEESYTFLFDENTKASNKVKEELIKMEVSNKALWDSFALLSTSITQKC